MTLKAYWGGENMREIKFRAWNCETKQFDPCFYFLTEGDGITNKIIGKGYVTTWGTSRC